MPLSLILLLTLRETQHRACDSNSQSKTYRDLDDASLNFQDRSKSPCSKSFLQQVYELRNTFALNDRPTSYQICQIAAKTGLRDFEVSMWFQTERDLRTKWRKLGPEIVDTLSQSPGHGSKTPAFLERIHALRESFRENLMCTRPQLLLASSNLDLQEFEVSLWFASERCIQLDLMMSNVSVKEEPALTYCSTTETHFQASCDGMKFGVEENKHSLLESFHQESMSMSPSEMDVSSLASVLGKRTNSTRPDLGHTMDAPIAKHRKKRAVQGTFECLFTGCHSKTTDISRWRDHQSRKHFPRQIWICWMNRSDGSLCQHGPVLRADNFMTHLIKEHNQARSTPLLELVQSKSQSVTNLFHDRCGFCKVFLNSWDESMKHIGAHLCCGIDPSQWDHCCSSSHSLQKYVNKEIVELAQSPSSAILRYPDFSAQSGPVYEESFNTCLSPIVLDEVRGITQPPSLDIFPEVQYSSVSLILPIKDCGRTEYPTFVSDNSVPRRGRRTGPLSPAARKSAMVMRRIGACVRCRLMKIRVSLSSLYAFIDLTLESATLIIPA